MTEYHKSLGEHLMSSDPRIIGAKEFDAAFAAGKLTPSDISVCTTMPLSRYEKDLRNEDQNIPQWLLEFQVEETITGHFWRRKVKRNFENHTKVLIPMNRDDYGWAEGFSDVLRQYPEASAIIYTGNYAELIRLGRIYHEFSPLLSRGKFFAMVEANNTHPHHKPKPETIQAAVDLAMAAFGSIDVIDSVLSEASRRQGVQVIYGGEGFRMWYAGQQTQGGDTPTHADRKLGQRIPSKFMAFVIPVGKYEQDRLLPQSA